MLLGVGVSRLSLRLIAKDVVVVVVLVHRFGSKFNLLSFPFLLLSHLLLEEQVLLVDLGLHSHLSQLFLVLFFLQDHVLLEAFKLPLDSGFEVAQLPSTCLVFDVLQFILLLPQLLVGVVDIVRVLIWRWHLPSLLVGSRTMDKVRVVLGTVEVLGLLRTSRWLLVRRQPRTIPCLLLGR